ncbi:MAG: hypothetical protein QNI84_00635 [Henriciella sp.]|nr:hypothetical protein [Henriciella sp.]
MAQISIENEIKNKIDAGQKICGLRENVSLAILRTLPTVVILLSVTFLFYEYGFISGMWSDEVPRLYELVIIITPILLYFLFERFLLIYLRGKYFYVGNNYVMINRGLYFEKIFNEEIEDLDVIYEKKKIILIIKTHEKEIIKKYSGWKLSVSEILFENDNA